MMHRFLATLLAATLVMWSAAGHAQPKDEARSLFNAGVAAYKQGQFMTAAQAFIKAHKILPKAELLFSIAQAFKREFDDKNQKEPLAAAVKYYRQYLDEVKDGGRRLEAAKALGDLKPILQSMGGEAGEMRFPTRLSVNSPAPNAVAILDGGAPQGLPWNTQIKPGQHTLEIRASGYRGSTQTFNAAEGDILPFNVPLDGIAPTLQIDGADGADVTVDGKLLGTAPFTQPLPVSPGRHFIAVTERGHKAYAEELEFDYGAKTNVSVDLPSTNQRRVAWGVLAGGGATLITSGILVGLALAEESTAKDIEALQTGGPITDDQRIQHNTALRTRDDLVLASAITAAAGGAITITGLFLFLFDEPEVRPPLPRSEDSEDEKPTDETDEIELVGSPIVGPGLYGLGLSGRF